NVDAVLNGASTLRKSGSSPRLGDSVLEGLRTSRGLPKTPLGVVLTGSGRLPLDAAFFTETSFEAVVFATDETPADRLEALRSSGRAVEVVSHAAAAVQMLRVLRTQYGVRSLLCEGGA